MFIDLLILSNLLSSNISIGKEILLQMHWQMLEEGYWKDTGQIWNIEMIKLWKPFRFFEETVSSLVLWGVLIVWFLAGSVLFVFMGYVFENRLHFCSAFRPF